MKSIGEIALLLRKYKLIYIILNLGFDLLQYLMRLLFIILWINKIVPNKIVISNIHGRGYSDHPKYIVEELNRRKANYDIVWVVHDETDATELPENIRSVKQSSIKSIYEFATAKIWVDNAEKRLFFIKRKGQYYIQTWHGFGPKKIITNDTLTSHEIKMLMKHNSEIIDICISNNQLMSQIYRDDFGYNGSILSIGFPRNDLFFLPDKSNIKEKVYSTYSLSEDQRIILYAPTYSETGSIDMFDIDFKMILESFTKYYSGNWVMLLRLHPVMSTMSSIICENNKEIIDVSNYIDMQELLLVSDVLITDYSSSMFDFALTKKPCFLYHPDVEEYKNTRGFRIQPEELPFPRASSHEELARIIKNFNQMEYEQTLNECFERYHMCDNGTASKAVVDWIEQKINPLSMDLKLS